jgi:hypothetical protein
MMGFNEKEGEKETFPENLEEVIYCELYSQVSCFILYVIIIAAVCKKFSSLKEIVKVKKDGYLIPMNLREAVEFTIQSHLAQ